MKQPFTGRHPYTGTKQGGLSKTRIYNIWIGMMRRCSDKAKPGSERKGYFDKGIRVCDEWKVFKNFYDWAMLNGYEENLSIDRKESSGGYNPDNCRWATNPQQQANRGKINGVNSKYKGVILNKKTGRWMAWIGYEKKRLYLGTFKNEIDAAKAVDRKAVELYGEFAHLNVK